MFQNSAIPAYVCCDPDKIVMENCAKRNLEELQEETRGDRKLLRNRVKTELSGTLGGDGSARSRYAKQTLQVVFGCTMPEYLNMLIVCGVNL